MMTFVRSTCMFFHERETTLNHLQWILCFHESLREKHGIGLCIHDESYCVNLIYVVNGMTEKVRMPRKICTIAEAERDGGTERQELKNTPHLGAGLSACQLEERRQVGIRFR